MKALWGHGNVQYVDCASGGIHQAGIGDTQLHVLKECFSLYVNSVLITLIFKGREKS